MATCTSATSGGSTWAAASSRSPGWTATAPSTATGPSWTWPACTGCASRASRSATRSAAWSIRTDVAGEEVVVGLAADGQLGAAGVAEDHRRAQGAVVVAGQGVAVGAGDGDGHQVAGAGVAQGDTADQPVAGFAVAADQFHRGAAADAAGDGGLEPLAVQGDLHVVGHPAVDGHEARVFSLHRDHPVDGHAEGGDQAAAWLDDELRVGWEVAFRGVGQGGDPLLRGGRVVIVGVADAEAAAEVVDTELA